MKAYATKQIEYYKGTTFNTSSSFQVYKVPGGISKLLVDCAGSKGLDASDVAGGKGGRIQCEMTVTPGQTLYVMVGATGTTKGTAVYNAADIRTNNAGVLDSTSLASRIVVAGGGGNASTGTGGAGGGLIGGSGGEGTQTGISTGGTQTSGGVHGSASVYATNGSDGALGIGGNGGGVGGAGGAGYYGGAGGSQHEYYGKTGGGGGGGSSYASNICNFITHTQGYRDGAGYVTIYTPASASNYDIVKQSNQYKIVKDNNLYKAFGKVITKEEPLVDSIGEITKTFTLSPGVYYIEITGGGGRSSYSTPNWPSSWFTCGGGSGASVYGEFYLPTSSQVTLYGAPERGTSYFNIENTRIITANPGGSTLDSANGGTGTINTGGLITNISLEVHNGNAGVTGAGNNGTAGASVSPNGWGAGGKPNNLNNVVGVAGGIVLEYRRDSI